MFHQVPSPKTLSVIEDNCVHIIKSSDLLEVPYNFVSECLEDYGNQEKKIYYIWTPGKGEYVSMVLNLKKSSRTCRWTADHRIGIQRPNVDTFTASNGYFTTRQRSVTKIRIS
jgi:hypothetical protein